MFSFACVEKSTAIPVHSDKIDLPASVLELLVKQHDPLPHPLTFRLATATNVCYAGVREFSAPENTILVSGDLYEALKGEGGFPVQAELVELPKATDLSIKPLKLYKNILNWKWFLEAKLTKYYCSLTRGQTLHLEDEFGSYELLIDKLEPAPTVCIIDTDINLDVVPLNDEMAKQFLHRETIDAIRVNQSAQTDKLLKLELEDHERVLITADTDYVVSNLPNVSDHSFIWHTLNGDNKLMLQNTFPYFEKTLYLLPFGPTLVQLSAYSSETVNPVSSDNVCSNCGATVAATSKIMHENFCLRNNVKCPHGCGKVFLRTVPENHWHCCEAYGDDEASFNRHRKYYHEPVTLECSRCSQVVSTRLVDHCVHVATSCPYTLHECRFCHLMVPKMEASTDALLSGMSQHELECGSKTTECPRCKRNVRLRDLESHMKLHELNRVSKPKPVICSNVNCIREAATSNELKLCDFCFGPLYSPVNDPTGQKLRSRVERRYILQLNSGCGNTWCKNKECKSSGMVSFKNFGEILNHIKTQLMSSPVFYFCVDLATTKKMLMVSLLLDEHEYDRAWICKAVQANVNLDDVRSWLSNNAVRIDEA
ncbi:hypothetical protein KL925_001590 [Ogataea polymorpha]|nr:hypothetical protein KL925_001590 [Ogataea polymorpha]